VQSLVIERDGRVIWKQHFLMVLRCLVHLRDFPFDRQTCQVSFGSYDMDVAELDYAWDPHAINMEDGCWEFVEYHMVNASVDRDTFEGVPDKTFRQMIISLNMEHMFRRYLWNTYLPVFCLGLIAYCSYWIGPYAAPARVTMGVVSTLTCSVQLNRAESYTQENRGHMTAMELYVLFHFMFVFTALVEYSLLNFLLGMAFGMNPPKSVLGMQHKRARAVARLQLLESMRVHKGHLPVCAELGELSVDELQEEQSVELLEHMDSEEEGFLPAEMRDFFAATDADYSDHVSFAEVCKTLPLLGLEELHNSLLLEIFLRSAALSRAHEPDDSKVVLDYEQFLDFMAEATLSAFPDSHGRGVHVPVEQQPRSLRLRRWTTWFLDHDPLLVDSWMRLIALPVLLLYNICYAAMWTNDSPLAVWLKRLVT